MLHVVKMLQRHYPERAGTIMHTAVIASASALLAGLGLLLLG